MASRANYRNRLRKKIRDWPKRDVLAAAIVSTTATTLTATTYSLYEKGGTIKIDNEEMLVRDINTTTITVVRGWHGTTAATHVINSIVYIFSFFADEELNQYIEAAITDLWPGAFRDGLDGSVTLASGTYIYDVPAAIIAAEGIVTDIEYYTATEDRGVPIPYNIRNGKIYLYAGYDGTARIFYITPYALPVDDVTDPVIPAQYDELILVQAAAEALVAMTTDRGKYEKYVANQWHDNATGYELESHLRELQDKADALRERLYKPLPSRRRL